MLEIERSWLKFLDKIVEDYRRRENSWKVEKLKSWNEAQRFNFQPFNFYATLSAQLELANASGLALNSNPMDKM